MKKSKRKMTKYEKKMVKELIKIVVEALAIIPILYGLMLLTFLVFDTIS